MMRDWIRPAIMAGFSGFILGGAFVTAIISFVSPDKAKDFATAAGLWLQVIPTDFYNLITVLGVGYIAARSADKFTEARRAEADAISSYSSRSGRDE